MKNAILFSVLLLIIYFLIVDYVMKFRPILKPFIRRKCDRFGCGTFGASRGGGSRLHKGLDVLCKLNQPVYAAFGGTIRLFKPYADYSALDGIELTGISYKVKTMYVKPVVKNGQKVHAGDLIGYAQSLQAKYPGISDHIHVEVWTAGIARNPTNFFPPDSLTSLTV